MSSSVGTYAPPRREGSAAPGAGVSRRSYRTALREAFARLFEDPADGAGERASGAVERRGARGARRDNARVPQEPMNPRGTGAQVPGAPAPGARARTLGLYAL